MKKKIGFLALVLAILMCFFTVSAFAAGDENGNSQMPFVESEQISPEHPDIQTEADIIEEFQEMFGEGSEKLLYVAFTGIVFMLLFVPSLIVAIVFGVLNGKAKRKIKEYERYFTPVPVNMPNTYNTGSYNYYQQPNTNTPYGNAPAGSYMPQNDENNQQGGSC